MPESVVRVPPEIVLSPMEIRAVKVTGQYALDVITARWAMKTAASGPGTENWDAFVAARQRWRGRPRGRPASPGDISGLQEEPRDYPHGGDISCRRCHGISSMEGHPYGCPRTPESPSRFEPLRLCYCGQTTVAAPDTFGPCCENVLPVRIPGGCRYCGSDLCRVNDPDDLPEKNYYVRDIRHPEMGDTWVHPHCVDNDLLARAPAIHHVDLAADVDRRRRERHLPLGVIDA